MNTTDLMPGAGRRGRDRVGEVAGRGAGQHRESELASRGQRDRHDAVLERVRRVAAVVLDPQRAHAEFAGEVVGAHQLRHAGLEVRGVDHVRRHRQQLLVAPDVVRAGLDRLAGDARVVVGHLERTEALFARVTGADRILRATLATRQRGGGSQDSGSGKGRDGHGETLSSSFPRTVHGPELAPASHASCTEVRCVNVSKWLPGLLRAGPSAPLDERYEVVRVKRTALPHRPNG